MFDGLILFGRSIGGFLDPLSIGLILLSSLVGVVIGALPGLTATMGIALMTTLTIKLPPAQCKALLQYAERMFARPAFRAALSAEERAMRAR